MKLAETTTEKAPETAKAGFEGVRITDSAAEEIRRQAAKRGTPDAAIRLGVRGGGCTGFAYVFEWEDGEGGEKDRFFTSNGVRVVVDPKSLLYLEGTELDYVKSLMGHGFKFNNPNVSGSCGCGESVQF